MQIRGMLLVGVAMLGSATTACTRSGSGAGPKVAAETIGISVPASSPQATARVPAPTSTSTSTSSSTSSSTSTSTTSSSTSTTSTTSTTRHVTMAFTGDVLPHSPLWRQAARNAQASGADGLDFVPMLAGLEPLLDSVDLAVCHLETPIAPLGEEFTTAPVYGVPAEIAGAIAAAGYERCSTASNHTADRGGAGVDRTLDVLDANGLGHSGSARTPAEIAPRVFDVAGVAVAHLSYTFSYNGLRFPEGEEWRSALIDPDRIVTDAETARQLGAEIVIVSMHWGTETVTAPDPFQRSVAEQITASGLIDLVVGHHAHVVQPIEQVNGTWVVYGLGNILSNLPASDFWPAAAQDAMVVTVGFTVDGAGHATIDRPVAHPTWVDKDAGWVARIVADELARTDLGAGQRGRLERSWQRTVDVVGAFVAPIPSQSPG